MSFYPSCLSFKPSKANYQNIMHIYDPTFSIITVVLNGENIIRTTLDSIANQTYKNFELIVIDGGSTDNTIEMVNCFQKNINLKYLTEKDDGIYDAMNKGIELSKGKWILFMNAGDCLFDQDTLQYLASSIKSTDHIIYGDNKVIYSSKKQKVRKAGQYKDLWKGSQFCHQSSIIKSDIHKRIKFNTSYRLAADFDFFYQCNKDNLTFRKVNAIISKTSAGGVSDTQRIKVIKEWQTIAGKNFFINSFYFLLIFIELSKKTLKKIITFPSYFLTKKSLTKT